MEDELLKRKKNNKKKIILGSIIGVLIGTLISVSYAAYTYSRNGTYNNKLITGDIYMRYKEGSALNLQGAMPSNSYPAKATNNYYEFQIIGKNTSSGDISYTLKLAHGDIPTGKSSSNRIADRWLYFKLVEVTNLGANNESETVLVANGNYTTIPNAVLYTETIPKNTTNETIKTYRLYARIDYNLIIGNTANANYSQTDWNNLFASVKINAEGGYVAPPPPTAAETISTKEGIETVSYGKIYTGASPDNYVLFNCTNDSDPSTCEEWRIIGVYTDATKGDMLKIVRGTPSTTGQVYRSSGTGNAWDGSDIQSYLVNTYYPTLSTTAKGMIEEVTWKVGAAAQDANAGGAYTSAGETTWTGKIGLVASYEYLYAAGSSCQNTAGTNNVFTPTCTSQDWLWPVLTNNKNSSGWCMSPYSDYASSALYVNYASGYVSYGNATNYRAASPAVYLKSTITITGGNGGSGVANAYRLG